MNNQFLDDAVIVFTSVENQKDGEILGRLLVERNLAACVQILPQMTSIYRWQGKLESATENLLLIKTTQALYSRIETVIRENHPYQTPEILAVPVVSGSDDYLTWLRAALASDQI